LIGPIISGALMQSFGPWVPIFVVYGCIPPTYLILMLIPETLKIEKKAVPREDSTLLATVKDNVRLAASQFVQSLAMLRNRNILLMMSAFFIQNPLIVAYTSTLAQYISMNFNWTLAETSYLLSPLSILHLVILALLPKISEILVAPNRRWRMDIFTKDLRLAQLSWGFIIVGALLEGFSQEIILFLTGLFVGTFGGATSPLSRAIITEYVDAEHTSRLFALVSIVETVGSFFGGPVLAWCFDVGIERKGLWRGLPWYYISVLCGLVLLTTFFVKEPKRKDVGEEVSGGAEPDDTIAGDVAV
jgi:MFS transporter, PCFT/HCP family, solute carrier family 46 (folate transporter), member 1